MVWNQKWEVPVRLVETCRSNSAGTSDMKLSSKDLRTLHQAAKVADAQRELVESQKKGFSGRWHAEAGMLVLVSGLVLGVGAIITSATMSPDNDLTSKQVVLQRVATVSSAAEKTSGAGTRTKTPLVSRE